MQSIQRVWHARWPFGTTRLPQSSHRDHSRTSVIRWICEPGFRMASYCRWHVRNVEAFPNHCISFRSTNISHVNGGVYYKYVDEARDKQWRISDTNEHIDQLSWHSIDPNGDYTSSNCQLAIACFAEWEKNHGDVCFLIDAPATVGFDNLRRQSIRQIGRLGELMQLR